MNQPLLLGVDVGSTTVKLAAIDPTTERIVYHRYVRHGSHQRDTTRRLLQDLAEALPDHQFRAIVTGSGGRPVADRLELAHVQEVVANSVAVRRFYPETSVAIELGGQDAKVIFFHRDELSGQLQASDMRMNGSCAGGTGAFIDEVAKLLRTPVEQFDDLAARGTVVHQISGRCGVFAKTDIQPLLNQGVDRGDLALSTFHAVARQTIGGLAQGLTIVPPVIFQGGPLTFNHTLVDVFKERLGLSDNQVIRPDQPEVFVAHGAALAIPLIAEETSAVTARALAEALSDSQLSDYSTQPAEDGSSSEDPIGAFFVTEEDRTSFLTRHARPDWRRATFEPGTSVPVWIGIDAGSTTTKLVVIDEDDTVLDSAYSHNQGEPLRTGARLLSDILERYEAEGVELVVNGLGTTGYGEKLFASAFGADYHTVETVAHAHAALKVEPNATFVLDIGGQDMKAITIVDGIVTGISLNEACSAGCGSFLENFASNLEVPVEQIAGRAFASKQPSQLGSRCTVFMNSSIITEQKNGKGPDDILAGLCRSIVENVFTKVVRVPNFGMLGNTVVVQGGTFENDAVLRALEQYTDRRVVRAPFPGLMGALGIAQLTRETTAARKAAGAERIGTFDGIESVTAFDYSQEHGLVCPHCSNACNRTVLRFANGSSFVSGNRCERGEVLEKPSESPESRERLRSIARRKRAIPNLMADRENLLRAASKITPVMPPNHVRIGIPMALEFWNSLPFWRTFWEMLGYEVVVSSPSSQELYEKGLPSVPSDTVCFPAKLSHGHLLDLIDRKVDRLFMPMVNRMPPENQSTKSNYVCAVVKGYPLVLDISDEPGRRHGVPFDRPMFHWTDERSRRKQIVAWATEAFGLDFAHVEAAIKRADQAQHSFVGRLRERGAEVVAQLEQSGDFGVVLAGRPYHADRVVNHDLAAMFVELGIPVLTVDSLPDLHQADLAKTRAELTINFHVRMYAAAVQVAAHPNLELCQIISFGCGHDAVVTDEVIRLMEASSSKTPLSLKLDETDSKGPLAIRVRSFIETVRARRERDQEERRNAESDESSSVGESRGKAGSVPLVGTSPLPDPFGVKFTKQDRKEKIIHAPNVTRSFSQVISAAIRAEGYRIEPLPLADRRAIELGKRYVHNDMCFPAQVNVGEMLRALETGHADPSTAVCGLAKSQCDCRLAHYATVARRALDDAGHEQIPIITTDTDTKGMHPGFSLSPMFQLRMLWALAMIDALEDIRRRLRPYEQTPGSIDAVFDQGMIDLSVAVEKSIRRATAVYTRVVDALAEVPLTDEPQRERVFIIGEFLLNFHPSSNFEIERYLEANGMEAVLPNILDSFRRDFMRLKTERTKFFVRHPFADNVMTAVTDVLFDHILNKIGGIAEERIERYERKPPLPEIAALSEQIVHHTFTSGEGWMIAGDILHHAAEGVRSFLILQPFGCVPNHITGRGIIKRLKEIHPEIQILSLDYDPDTSFANIENRLQMLILNSRMQTRTESAVEH